MKIDRERLNKIYVAKCPSCPECKYRETTRGLCRTNAISDILEQHPELIQTEPVFQVPVKKTWTLKKEYAEFFADLRHAGFVCEEKQLITTSESFQDKYSDLTETPDYSKIPVGAVVEINDFEHVGKVIDPKGLPENWHNGITIIPPNGYIMSRNIPFFDIKSLTILKMPEGKE